MSRIDILLATYNGARFLPEQLTSLAAQTHSDWRLLVRDDGSGDGSLDLVREWATGVSQPVEIIADGRSGLGAAQNFAALLAASDAPYFAFCDQDDSWLPEKLALMLKGVQTCEKGGARPVLAFTDLEVVDHELAPLAPSFRRATHVPRNVDNLGVADLALVNPVVGCATLGNAALRALVPSLPEGARMHDWWLAMAARAFGELLPMQQATVRYRQHGGNAVGALGWQFSAGGNSLGERARSVRERADKLTFRAARQAAAFASFYKARLDPSERADLRAIASLPHLGRLARLRILAPRFMAGLSALRVMPYLLAKRSNEDMHGSG